MSERTERVGIVKDEMYPTYGLDKPSRYAPGADVDVETLNRWRSAIETYEAVQEEMSAVHEAATIEMRRADAIAKAEKEAAEAQARLEALRRDS